MEEEIRLLIFSSSVVTGLVGDRVEWGGLLQGSALPAVHLRVVSVFDQYNLDGHVGLDRARLQVDCLGESYAESKVLSRNLRALLSGYRGGDILGLFHISSVDLSENGNNEMRELYRVTMDFNCVYSTGIGHV